jgi:hypothetical protein
MRAMSWSTGCIAGDSAISVGPLPRSSQFSASSRWPRRSGWPSSAWVPTMASSRAFSYGF